VALLRANPNRSDSELGKLLGVDRRKVTAAAALAGWERDQEGRWTPTGV